jgi:cyclopropane fatty-acyl-phospholipid synthase-like methyltransferase
MDIWKYYNITHKKHIICNPMNVKKLEGLFLLLDLKEDCRVLDIGCGKGEPLVRLAGLFGISGIGVDISPYFIKDCRKKKNERIPGSDVSFLEMDGAEYKPEENELFNLTMCLGASFAYQGFTGTIDALKKMTEPDGMIIIGEPYWIKEPDNEYLKMSEIKKEEFNTHYKNIDVAENKGLKCIYTLVSNRDDWDHYETLQWWSAYDYVSRNPDDPDNPELLSMIEKSKKEYLMYGRDTLGWAIYVFKRQ